MRLWRWTALGLVAATGLTAMCCAAAAWFAADSPVRVEAPVVAHLAQLTCGSTVLVVESHCSGVGLEQECHRQQTMATTIGQKATASRNTIGRAGAAAYSAQCMLSKTGEAYFALMYAPGGNCEECEWVDLLNHRLRPVVQDAQHHKRAVSTAYRSLRSEGAEVSLLR